MLNGLERSLERHLPEEDHRFPERPPNPEPRTLLLDAQPHLQFAELVDEPLLRQVQMLAFGDES